MASIPIQSTTQELLPVADIVEDTIVFKDGGVAIVLESTAVNFSLLAENEQAAIIYAYSALLNSLSFPIQVLVVSQQKDISNYLSYLGKKERTITNPKLSQMMASYRAFLSETVAKRNVLSKRFFIVIPFYPLELGIGKTLLALNPKRKTLPFPKDYVIKKAKIVLYPKRDHLIRQAGRLGISVRQVATDDLIKLVWAFTNPENALKTTQAAEYAPIKQDVLQSKT